MPLREVVQGLKPAHMLLKLLFAQLESLTIERVGCLQVAQHLKISGNGAGFHAVGDIQDGLAELLGFLNRVAGGQGHEVGREHGHGCTKYDDTKAK